MDTNEETYEWEPIPTVDSVVHGLLTEGMGAAEILRMIRESIQRDRT